MIGDETLSAFGGALVGGLCTILGGWFSHCWQQKSLKRKERETFRNVLRALKLEFEEFWSSYKISLELIKTRYPEERNGVFQLIKQEYFTVYNSNVSIFSQLQDEELQRLIIKTHKAFRSLLDKIEGKNMVIVRIENFFCMFINSDNSIYEEQLQRLVKELEKQAFILEETHEEINRLMNALIPKLNETIQSLK